MDGLLKNSTQSNLTKSECFPFMRDDSPSVKVIKAVCYSVLLLFSLFGNSAVIVVIWKNKHMRTTTNYLIANMAVSDLMLSAFAVPRELTENFTGPRRWLIDGLAGMALCKLVYFFQDISTAVSIQSLVVITVDRCAAVVTPYRRPIITKRRRRLVIPLIWLISMGLHGPYFYTARRKRVNNASFCYFSWEPAFDTLQAQRIYFTFVSVFLIGIPLAVITVLYSLIFRALKRQKLFWRRLSTFSKRRRKENTRVTKRILAIIILFVLCILPVDILGLLYYFAWQGKVSCGIEHVSFAAKFIFYSNASLNPCVYFLLNDRYREGLRTILKQCRDSLMRKRERSDIVIKCMNK